MTNKEQLTAMLPRIDQSIKRIISGQAAMRVPAEQSDPDLVLGELHELISGIAQASAAPEQEPFAYSFNYAHCVTSSGPESWKYVIERLKPADFLFEDGRIRDFKPLYTHADPYEVERLRAEVKTIRAYLSEAVDGLAEAKALIPDFGGKSRMDAWRKWLPKFIDRIGYEKKPNRNFLSATAQPAEVKS